MKSKIPCSMEMPLKSTVVIGATPNPARYAYSAVRRLDAAGHPVFPIGNRKGLIGSIPIIHGMPELTSCHTVTLYINSLKQKDYQSYILSVLRPERLIFNPGTENYLLAKLADQEGIEPVFGCTLVMLSIGNY